MTVAVEYPVTSYGTDGVTFSYPLEFTVSENSDVQVQLTDALGIVTTPAFSVSGGNAVLSSAPAAGGTLLVMRVTPLNQLADFSAGDSFASGEADGAFDRTVRIIQEIDAGLLNITGRALLAAPGDGGLTLPRAATLAGGNYVIGTDPGTGLMVLRSAASFKGDPGSSGLAVGLFTSLAGMLIPLGTDMIQTAGYAALGIGGGTYVADSLATAGLAAACPRLCSISGNGRYFRLIGAIEAEHAGASATAGFNNQPAIQACLDYSKAVGQPLVKLGKIGAAYEVWATLRTTNADDAWAFDGHHLVASATLTLDFNGSTLWFKSLTGASPETNWQVLTGAQIGGAGQTVWRGNGLRVLGGTQASPGAYNVGDVVVRNGIMDGGCLHTANNSAVNNTTGDGFDVFHKGIAFQNTTVGSITLSKMEIRGFKGEIGYLAQTECPTLVEFCWFHKTNGSCINPSSGNLTVRNCTFGDANIGAEHLGGAGSKWSNILFYDCTGGSSFFGAAGFGGVYNPNGFAWPSNTGSEADLPWIDFDNVTFQGGQVLLSCYARGNITLIDASLELSSYNSGVVREIDLNIKRITHKIGGQVIDLQGVPTATTAVPTGGGVYYEPIRNVSLRISESRTKYAVTNYLTCSGLTYSGIIEQDTVIVKFVSGHLKTIAQALALDFSKVKAMPLIMAAPEMLADDAFNTQYTTPTGGGTSVNLNVDGPSLFLVNAAGAGTITMGISAPFSAPFDYATTQILRIGYNGSSTAGTIFVFPKGGTNLKLNADRALVAVGDFLLVQRNAFSGKWHEVDFHSPTSVPGLLARPAYTTAQLPAASSSPFADAIHLEATAPTFGATVVGGGTVKTPIWSDGTNWKVG